MSNHSIPVNVFVDITKDELKELRLLKDQLTEDLLTLVATIQNREELLEALGEGPPVFGDNI